MIRNGDSVAAKVKEYPSHLWDNFADETFVNSTTKLRSIHPTFAIL